MNHIIFYAKDNRPGKKDATGAFIPESIALNIYIQSLDAKSKVKRVPIRTNVSESQRRQQVYDGLSRAGFDYDCVWFLCHGTKAGIQFGYRWKWGAGCLTEDLLAFNPAVKMVNFYCCSVAAGKENFCKWVYEHMKTYSDAPDVSVMGHYTAGHTTMNPRVKIYHEGFMPFIWSKTSVAGYNNLIDRANKEAEELNRTAISDFRFTVPFIPMIGKENGLTWGWK